MTNELVKELREAVLDGPGAVTPDMLASAADEINALKLERHQLRNELTAARLEGERLRNIVTGCPVCSELERNIKPADEPNPAQAASEQLCNCGEFCAVGLYGNPGNGGRCRRDVAGLPTRAAEKSEAPLGSREREAYEAELKRLRDSLAQRTNLQQSEK